VLAGVVAFTAAAWPRDTVRVDGFRVVASYPHDPQAFTQGLIYVNQQLYEGTGEKGRSTLRKVDLQTGRVQAQVPLTDDYFGEGITILGNRLYQLTWKNRLGIVYDADTLQPLTTFRYDGEGWGLTTDGQHLILSDGTAVLRFLDPKTFEVARRLTVRTRTGPVKQLNELEYVEGEILANLWYQDRIARIDPHTGDVRGWIDLSTLYPAAQRGREDVLNGIAYDAEGKRLFVTGKHWPRLYHIEIVPQKR
jgi:glutamine cyclotransferase